MKLAILGGGGFRVPLVHQALTTGQAGSGELIDELWLYDTDPGRLAVIENVLRQMPGSITLHATTGLDDALDGAAFVFSAIRVGGLAGRIVADGDGGGEGEPGRWRQVAHAADRRERGGDGVAGETRHRSARS